ncbi:MAG: Hpt domain-containing protein [Pseudomonadota bacterium]
MSAGHTADLTSVKWVLRELTPILNDVKSAIVSYVEAPEYSGSMDGVVGMLRQVYGTTQMIELYGAAMLAEEMERIVQELREEKLSNRDECLEILMRAALQLPDYLERIKAGSPDVPLVLLPLLNDLRAARGEALLSEAVLFVPDLSTIDDGTITLEEEQELTNVVRSQRLPFMRALLDWYNDDGDRDSLDRMSRVFSTIENSTHSPNSQKIWIICRALVESLVDEGLKTGTSIKLLFGQIERSLKQLLERGEMEFVRSLPQDMLKNLLYYIARSSSTSPLVAEIRTEYRLEELLPQQNILEEARRTHQGPSIELLRVANEGVRDDIGVIKDLIEIYVHADERKLSMLDSLDGLLSRVCDTLSMLGIGEARGLLAPRQTEVREILAREEDPGDDRLFDIAALLLKIEDMLDRHVTEQTQLIKTDQPVKSDTPDILSLRDLPEREYDSLIQSLVKESMRAIARTREAFLEFAGQSDNAAQIQQVPGVLREVRGAFSFTSSELILPLLDELSALFAIRYVERGVVPDQFEQELIADAIAGLEYYLEAVPEEAEAAEREYVLDMSRSALEQLKAFDDVEPASDTEGADAEDDSVQFDEEDDTQVVDLTDIGADAQESDEPLPDLVEVDADGDSGAPAPSPDLLANDLTMQIDNLVEGDMEHDQTIMLESLLDSDIDDDLTIQLDRFTLTEDEYETQDENTDEARQTTPPPQRPEQAKATQPVASEPARTTPARTATISSGDLRIISDDVDEEILEVFIEEALDELSAITEHLPKWKQNPDDEESLARVRRAFHTLKGSGRLVGAERLGEFAWHNENTLNYVMRGDLPVNDRLLGLLDESIAVLPQLIAQLREQNTEVEITELLDNISQLTKPTSAPKTDSADASPTLADIEAADTVEASAEPESLAPEAPAVVANDSVDFDLGDDGVDPLDISVVDVDEFDDIDVEEVIAFDLDDLDFTVGDPDEEPSAEVVAGLPRGVVDHGIDPALLEIFNKESRVHLDALREILDQSQQLSGTVQPNDNLIRALHTLHGSAQTAQVDAIAKLTGPFEKVAKHKREIGSAFDPKENELLDESVECVRETLDALITNNEIPDRAHVLAEQIAGYTEQSLAEIDDAPVDDGDGELRRIFIEEAEELINSAESIITMWRESPEDNRPVSEMKRRLHTLKGGARMAGYSPVADLTHALESSIIAREVRGGAPDPEYFDLLQEAVDALAVNVEQARKGQAIGHFDWIIEDLNRALGADVTDADEIPEPDSIEPEPSQEQDDYAAARMVADPDSAPTIAELASRAQESTVEKQSDEPAAEDGVAEQAHDTSEPIVESIEVVEVPADPPPPPAPETSPATPAQAAAPTDESDNLIPLKVTARAIDTALREHAQSAEASSPASSDDRHQEQVRVRSELLDNLVNNAGEVSIYHARFGQQIGDMRFNLNELDQTVDRLREQLRLMDQETEAQILYGYDKDSEKENKEFDPLELDRYSQIQELSRSLLESVADLESIKGTLADLTRDSETLLMQQSRVSTELQEGLLRTRMVRFDGVEARLSRIVRQTATSLKKKAALSLTGGENEIDRGVQERMIAPIEHILRNAVAHGIESPKDREKAGKPVNGKVAIRLSLDGGDILIRIVDDGAGISVESVRKTAIERELVSPDVKLADQEVLNLLFESGFSTASEVTQIAGRGIGLDVVGREIKQLGGSLTLESEEGVGTMFVIRLPQTLAISQALLVESAGQTYAVPINGIRGVSRVNVAELSQYYLDPEKRYNYAGEDYSVVHLNELLQVDSPTRQPAQQAPLIMVRSGDEMAGVQVDELIGRREIVVKSAGEQVSMLRGIAGATLLGDGKVVLVLDIGGLLQTMERGNIGRELDLTRSSEDTDVSSSRALETPLGSAIEKDATTVLVVDDSITIRKVTARMLERHKLNVITAKDGVDAVSLLNDTVPELMLLDIEMPRMDGFEVASYVRADERLRDLPIIVITSRTGEKHRQRMFDIGVDKYLGKPYQENELIALISEVLDKELVAQ